MSILSNVKVSDDVKEEKISLGAGGVWETNVYPCIIEAAYVSVAKTEAIFVNIHARREDGQVLKTALCVQSGKAKGSKNYWVDKKNGDKQYLPGFNQANAISLLSVGKGINELDEETKVIKLWDFDASKELPKEVPMLVELVNQEITLGVLKQVEDKNVKNENGDYVPSGETREVNEVERVFRTSDGLNTLEIKAGETEAVFIHDWKKKWEGKVKNKSKGATAGTTAGAPAGSAAAPKKSIFAAK